MTFSLSTHWNAFRHATGEAMIEEILELGIDHVELGYDLNIGLVEGVARMVSEGAVTVASLHNFCPIPIGAPCGHPELFTFGSRDAQERESAVLHTSRTIRFAAELGAKAVVTHVGNIDMPPFTRKLVELRDRDKQYTSKYERIKTKVQVRREKRAPKQLPFVYQCLEQLMPLLEETGVRLGIENLPTWEAIPTEAELLEIVNYFNSPHIGHWHDMGHGHIRQVLGFISHERWLDKLGPYLVGMHIHDVVPPCIDHAMPPNGEIDFARFARFGAMDVPHVLEPNRGLTGGEVAEGLRIIREAWSEAPATD